jgi:TonB family protein
VRVRTRQIFLGALVFVPFTLVIGVDARQSEFRDRFCRSTSESTLVEPFAPELHRVGDKGVTPPKATRQKAAQYPADAMEKKVQGCVVIQAVVEVDGRVRRHRVIQPLDESLDRASIDALEEWEFAPGTFQGTPIPVVVIIEMTFSLRN